ncbi:hypothetical protein ES703_106730 [subsurface metagenome]
MKLSRARDVIAKWMDGESVDAPEFQIALVIGLLAIVRFEVNRKVSPEMFRLNKKVNKVLG